MRIHILYYLIATILLYSCKSNDNNEDSKKINLEDYLGVWHSVRQLEYGAELEIDFMNGFVFDGGACTSSFLSKGSWTLKDDTIVLNSFQPKEFYYLQYFGDDCIAPPLIGDTSKYVERTSVKGCNPEYHRIYIMFYNERFILRNDTLIHILRTKYRCSDIIKNDFIKQK